MIKPCKVCGKVPEMQEEEDGIWRCGDHDCCGSPGWYYWMKCK